MNLLIVGCGMYVTGRGNTAMGTVLTAVKQTLNDDPEHRIVICATREDNRELVAEACRRINKTLRLTGTVAYEAYNGSITGLERIAAAFTIDVAIVATPDHLHFEQVRMLLGRGIHCLCVKPLVATRREHQLLIDAATKNNVYGAIEFHKRWDESNLHVKKIINQGELGKLHNVTVDYSQRIMIPAEVFSAWVDKTNIFQYLGVHYVDLIHWLTAAIPVRLMCHGTKGKLEARGINTWDSVHVWVEWQCANEDKFVVQFNLSWIDPDSSSALSDQKFNILGTGGRYHVDQKHRGIEANLHGYGVQQVNPWFSEILPTQDGTYEMQGYAFKSINTFLNDVKRLLAGEITPASLSGRRPTFADCLPSTAVIETVNRCLHGHQWEVVEL